MITLLVGATTGGLSLATGYALGVRRRPAHRAGRRYLGSIGAVALRAYPSPVPVRRAQHRPPAGAL